MREIKFRAWYKKGGYMLDAAYGDWVSFDGVPYTEAENPGNTANIEVQKAKDYILMQFTGLKDKNGKGKEIYHKDYFETTKGRGVVEQIRGCWVVKFDSYSVGLYDFIANDFDMSRKIIGNIYEP